jgi:subtilisin-like proprotein convertase family protein
VVSCAHVVFDDFLKSGAAVWTNDNKFFRSWNGSSSPEARDGVPLRGYTRWSAYSDAVRTAGGDSLAAFRNDFVVHYCYLDLIEGSAPRIAPDGIKALTGVLPKLVTGYPGGLYEIGDPLEYRLHATGPFSGRMSRESGRYFYLDGVGTGAGNSGGPVWVKDAASSDWILAGVLVSGTDFLADGTGASIGVVAVDAAARSLVQAAVKLGQTLVTPVEPSPFEAAGLPLAIPDNNRNGVSVDIPVSVSSKRAGRLALGIRITHPYPGDLEITLRAPGRGRGGKSLLVARPVASGFEDLEWESRRLTGFDAVNPSGTWRLSVRDLGPGDAGKIESATLFLGGN